MRRVPGRMLPVVVALAVLSVPGVARAGPWTPAPGHGYLKVWLKGLYGFDYRSGAGETIGYGGYGEIMLSAYAEVGIADGVALALHFPLLQTFLLEDPRPEVRRYGDHTTIGDPQLTLRYRIALEGGFAMALEGGVRVPFAPGGDRQDFHATREGLPRVGALRIGTGIFDFPVWLSAGYAWERIYVGGAFGWVYRTADFDPVWMWSAEGGGTFDGGAALRVRVSGWHSLPYGDPSLRHESPSGIGSGTSYVGFQIEMDTPIVRDEHGAPRWWVGGTVEGGIYVIARQTGGPVATLFVATYL